MTKNIIALAVLGVLVAVAAIVFQDRPSEDVEKAKSTIQPVPEARLDTIRITRKSTDDGKSAEQKIVLKKSGDVWRMVEPVDYKVVEGTVDRMVTALTGLKVVDIISENKEKHGDFQVDSEGGIEVAGLEGETQLARLVFGKSRNSMTFVRQPDKDEVYRIQGYHRSTFDKTAESLRDKTIIKQDMDKIEKVVFKNDAGELSFEFTGEGAERSLQPVGVQIQNFNETKATGVVRTLASLSAREFVDEALPEETTGLSQDAPSVVLELSRGDGKSDAGDEGGNTTTLWIGKEDTEKKQTYVKSSESNQVFTISSSTADRLLAKVDDYARTDEDLKKEEERQKKAAEAAAQRGGGPMGMGGMGGLGNQQIPPELMRQIQAQMAKNPQ